jgi:putative hemolysin
VEQGVDADLASTLGVGGVVVMLTYLSLIIGELVPKQLALRNPEAIAIRVAPAMNFLSRIAAPVVWLLDRSGKLLLRLLGASGEGSGKVTEEEVHTLLTEARAEGLIEPEEREMMAGVVRLADRTARALMTPRHEVEMLDLTATPGETVAAIRRIARPRMPVRNPETDEVVGIITLSEAFDALSRRQSLDPARLLREVPVVSDKADALDVMEILRGSTHHLALVYDEYGHFEGIITSGDILEAITGTVALQSESEPALLEREDGSMLVSGWMPADEFCDRLGIPRDLAGGYETVAGLVLNLFGRLPALAEATSAEGFRFEVIDLDDRRIDKVLVTRLG